MPASIPAWRNSSWRTAARCLHRRNAPLTVLALALLFAAPAVRGQTGDSSPFIRGDANADGREDITDAIVMLGFTFLGDPAELPCVDAADVDDDGRMGINDALYLLQHKFLGLDAPPAPFSTCGADPTPDSFNCESFTRCAAE